VIPVVRFAIKSTPVPGFSCVQTLHYRTNPAITGDFVVADLESFAEALGDALMPTLRDLVDTSARVDEITATEEQDPLNPDEPRSGAIWSIDLPGLRPITPAVPVELASFVQFRTGQIGRSFRGGVWTPPLLEASFIAGELLESGAQTRANAFAAAIPLQLDITIAYDLQLVVYSRTRRGRSLTPYWADVTEKVASPDVRWLRSRGR